MNDFDKYHHIFRLCWFKHQLDIKTDWTLVQSKSWVAILGNSQHFAKRDSPSFPGICRDMISMHQYMQFHFDVMSECLLFAHPIKLKILNVWWCSDFRGEAGLQRNCEKVTFFVHTKSKNYTYLEPKWPLLWVEFWPCFWRVKQQQQRGWVTSIKSTTTMLFQNSQPSPNARNGWKSKANHWIDVLVWLISFFFAD